MPQTVVQGAMLQCIFGAAPGTLNVLPINRIMIGGVPAANMMDNKPFVNIMPFGMCTSPSNPTVIAKFGAPSPCTPMTMAPWIMPSTTLCGPAPLLNNTGKLMCAFGGLISITFPGQINTMSS